MKEAGRITQSLNSAIKGIEDMNKKLARKRYYVYAMQYAEFEYKLGYSSRPYTRAMEHARRHDSPVKVISLVSYTSEATAKNMEAYLLNEMRNRGYENLECNKTLTERFKVTEPLTIELKARNKTETLIIRA